MTAKKKQAHHPEDRQEEKTLKTLAPHLFSIKKRSPFHLKDGEEIELEKVWEKEERSPFHSENTDFQNIQDRVFASIEQKENRTKRIKIHPIFAWSAAAAILIAVAVSFFAEEKTCQDFACLLKESELSEAELLILMEESDDEVLLLVDDQDLNYDFISDDELMELMEDTELEIEDIWYE